MKIRQEHAKEPLSTPLEFCKPGLETTRALAVKYGDVRLNFLFFIEENNEKTKKRRKRRKKAKNVVDNDGKE